MKIILNIEASRMWQDIIYKSLKEAFGEEIVIVQLSSFIEAERIYSEKDLKKFDLLILDYFSDLSEKTRELNLKVLILLVFEKEKPDDNTSFFDKNNFSNDSFCETVKKLLNF